MDLSGEKVQLDILPWDALEVVARVFMFGAEKHERDGWKDIPNAVIVYRQAMGRHLSRIYQGEDVDDESGLYAEAHVAADALIAIAHRIKAERVKELTKK